jgi:hypothetical protein
MEDDQWNYLYCTILFEAYYDLVVHDPNWSDIGLPIL